MLEISGSSCEGCSSISYTDTTGPYADPGNLTGYGTENGVTGPAAFDTYTLEIWFPNTLLTEPADYTLNLKTSVPPVDPDGFYTWDITKVMLGVDPIKSGVYTMTATGVLSGSTYVADLQCVFVADIESEIDDNLKSYDPDCGCADCAEDPLELFVMLQTVKCGGICDGDKTQKIIDNLYANSSQCC